MEWWKMSFAKGWVTKEELRWAIISPENPFGDITKEDTKEEFKMITDSDF